MEVREMDRYRGVFTKVPGDPSQWRRWEQMGHRWIRDYRRQQGNLPTSLICEGGEQVFPRYFQLLAQEGVSPFAVPWRGFTLRLWVNAEFSPLGKLLKERRCGGEKRY